MNPCGGNGTCYNAPHTLLGFECICVEGMYGPTCNFTTNPCANERPCNGNGYCRVVPNKLGEASTLCDCFDLYDVRVAGEEENCGTSICDQMGPDYSCQNNATCRVSGFSGDIPQPECVCPPGKSIRLHWSSLTCTLFHMYNN